MEHPDSKTVKKKVKVLRQLLMTEYLLFFSVFEALRTIKT